MGKILGIDLGTTNSCMAIMEGKEAKVIPNAEGHRTTPSVVGFSKSGELLVGQTAKRQAVINPRNTIFSVKRFMGRKFEEVKDEIGLVPYEVTSAPNGDVHISVEGKVYSPQEISAKILQKLKRDAEEFLGEPITEAVITVPAYFNDSQRQATKDAGRIAGLDVKRIINEPTAAALAYGMDEKSDQQICVYDLGGGTFDVSILELGDGVFEVKATNGDTHLGGDDFDEAIINWLLSEFKKETGVDLKANSSADPTPLQRLKEEAEKVKIELSSSKSVDINLAFITLTETGPKHLQATLSRAKLEQLTADLIDRSMTPVRNCLKDAGADISEINEVIMVGGQTRMPKVSEAVKGLFAKDPCKGVNPDEVVALGAAIQGGVLSGDVDDVVLLDVTPLTLGIETKGGVMTPLIERNTTIPTRKEEVFSTAADNQTAVDIQVYQGERKIASQNKKIGDFRLDGIEPAAMGQPKIQVTFDINANGILSVSAKDTNSGKVQSIKIQPDSGLTEEEIQRMVDEAATNAEADKKFKENVETKNKAESLSHDIKKQLAEQGDKVPAEAKASMDEIIKKLDDAIAANDYPTMEKVSQEIAQMQQQMGGAGPMPGAGPNPATDKAGADKKSDKKKDDDVIDADFDMVDDDK